MDTNVHDELLKTRKKRNASQTSAIVLKSLLVICDFDQGKSERPPSARRFVTLRASVNDVMRKLEVHDRFTGFLQKKLKTIDNGIL